MESYSQRGEKRRSSSEFGDDDFQSGSDENTTTTSGAGGKSPGGGKPGVDDKRMRREIANSNERRRMQSINAGFQSLKTLLPHQDGEKLSKAAILQQTTEYIGAVDSEKKRLQTQNEQLKRIISELSRENEQRTSPPPKRKKRDTEGSDEGIGGMSAGEGDEGAVATKTAAVAAITASSLDELRGELANLRAVLERERRLRVTLEERNRDLEARIYNNAPQQPTLTYHKQELPESDPRKVKLEAAHLLVAPPPPAAAPPAPAPAPPAVVKAEPPPPSMTTLPPPRAHIPTMNPAATSMSRRNLETIVEAIRHLEGESALFDFKKPPRAHAPHSEGESEKEGSLYSGDEERGSESSGRDSPPLFNPHHTTATATVHVRRHDVGGVVGNAINGGVAPNGVVNVHATGSTTIPTLRQQHGVVHAHHHHSAPPTQTSVSVTPTTPNGVAAIPLHVNGVTVTMATPLTTQHVTTQFVTSSEQRYPIATQLLHRPPPPSVALQQQGPPPQQQQSFTLHRPGVIVHNLS